MTFHSVIDSVSTTAVQARQMGLTPGAEQLILAAATELAEHGNLLPDSTREVLRGFMVMAMLAQMEKP
jgi:hypothetical protein